MPLYLRTANSYDGKGSHRIFIPYFQLLIQIIKESSLTEIGKHIFVELLFKWFAYTDNESGKIDRKNNIKMLEKYYNQLLQKIDRK